MLRGDVAPLSCHVAVHFTPKQPPTVHNGLRDLRSATTKAFELLKILAHVIKARTACGRRFGSGRCGTLI